MNTPIYNHLLELKKKKRIPFHMPGHKRKKTGAFFGVEEIDITEISGYDNLHQPEGIIRESMKLLKKIYGTRKSWYLVGGSTMGIFVSISSICRQGDKILIARNSHKAVYNCVQLLQLEAVYCYPEISETYDIYREIKPEEIEKQIKTHPDIKAVVITSPTYEGVVSDIKKIKEILLPYQIPLIVDEAHGAHLLFDDYFPDSAVECGADLVIQSTHKTLPSFTQTAVLHLCSEKIRAGQVEEMIDIYETSSPSYLLLASAEYGIMYMHENREKVNQYVDLLKEFRKKCQQLHAIQLLEKEILGVFDYDRGKLVFSIKNLEDTSDQIPKMDGKELFRILLEKYHIELEMENSSYVIAMTSVCDEKEDFQRLWEALRQIDRELLSQQKKQDRLSEKESGQSGYQQKKQDRSSKRESEQSRYQQKKQNRSSKKESGQSGYQKTKIRYPEKIKEAWECRDCPLTQVPMDEAEGRISGKYVMVYPPGIPMVVPGEKIIKEIVENVRYYLYNGYNVIGLSDNQFVVIQDYADRKSDRNIKFLDKNEEQTDEF